jgi:hypothetical protein
VKLSKIIRDSIPGPVTKEDPLYRSAHIFHNSVDEINVCVEIWDNTDLSHAHDPQEAYEVH